MRKFILLLIVLLGLSVSAAEYNFLVLPMNLVNKENTELINVNTEELLAGKIINQIIMTNLAITPNIKTIKSTIKNYEGESDIKYLMQNFTAQHVILITTNVEIKNSIDEKKFWSRLNIPMITNNTNILKIMTKVELMNNEKTIWKNTYFKNVDISENNINYYSKHLSKTEILNDYYDGLAISVVKEIKEFDKNIFKSKQVVNFALEQMENIGKREQKEKVIIKPEAENNLNNNEDKKLPPKVNEEKTKVIPTDFNINIKPNLEVKEDDKPQTKVKLIEKVKNSVKLKNDEVQQEIGENNIRNKNSAEKDACLLHQKTTVKDLTPITEEKTEPLKQQKWTDKMKEKYKNFVNKFKK